MKLKKLITLILIFSVSLKSMAQLGKSTYSIGGNANYGIEKLSGNITFGTPQNGTVVNSKSDIKSYGSISSFGIFTGKNTQLSVGLLLNNITTDSKIENYTINKTDKFLGFGFGLRQYIGQSPNFRIFFAGAINSLKFDIMGKDEVFGYSSFSFGGTYFIGNSLGLTGSLSYQKLGFQWFNKTEGINNYQFALTFENYLNTQSYTINAAEGLHGGRITVGGNILINYKEKNFDINIQPEFGVFITKSLLTGIELGYNFQNKSKYRSFDISHTYSANFYLRYYVPLSKRLFIYPEIKGLYGQHVTEIFYNLDGNGFPQSTNFRSLAKRGYQLNYNAAIGLNYFLKKNVALELNVLEFGTKADYNRLFLGGNIGLRYFLK
jgi:hypothetical protein